MSTGFNLKDNFSHETIVDWECQNRQIINWNNQV